MSVLIFVLGLVMMNPTNPFSNVEQYKSKGATLYNYVCQKIAEEESIEQEFKYGDAGHLDIPSIGVNVGLYYDSNAFQGSNKASYQYWIQYGKFWIADHNYQDGFGDLKNLSIGSVVNVCDEYGVCRSYTVAESIYYADYYSDFEGCGAYSKMMEYKNTGGIVLQTCECNGVILVFCK